MAIIITDMDMPKSCDECPISRYQELHDCPILRMYSTKHSEKRLDDCPLKSVDDMVVEIGDVYVGYRHAYEVKHDIMQIIDKYTKE